MKPLRWIVPLASVLVLVAWWAVSSGGESDDEWTVVERDDLILGVEVEGTLKAVRTDLIGPPQLRNVWQFKIAHMAPEGEGVSSGDVVLRFDTTELGQRLEREIGERDAAVKRLEQVQKELSVARGTHELRLSEAQARLEKAELKADRPVQLEALRELEKFRLDLDLARHEVGFLAERLDAARRSAEARIEAMNSQLEEAEISVAETRRAIEEMSRKAPREGTVIYVKPRWGEKKKIGDPTWKGEEILELPDLTEMKALGQVHEADAGQVAEGQSVRLKLDAHRDVEFRGRVASIWRSVERESRASPLKVVRLDIELDETDTLRMRPGMRFRGDVETERIADAVLVDVDSVFLKPGGPVVFRRTWSGHEVVPVELGRRSKRRVEVLEGLAAGDRVSLVDREARRAS